MSKNRCCHCGPCYPVCQPVLEDFIDGNANAAMNDTAGMYAEAPASTAADSYPEAAADANLSAEAPADAKPTAATGPDATAKNNYFPARCHVHEVVGSVMIAQEHYGPIPFSAEQAEAQRWPRPDPDEAHNHRFATVSSPPIPIPGGHVHEIAVRTDFYEDHFHLIIGTSGPAIPVGEGRHIHFLSGNTTVNDGHCHPFRATSLIEDPIGD